MRSINVIVFFLCLIPFLSRSQWQWQNPLPQGNLINHIWFLDQNTGYAVGGDIDEETPGYLSYN